MATPSPASLSPSSRCRLPWRSRSRAARRPEKGLYTAIIAGFLISALGGSRVQIGGPTAAFIPVVFVVIQKFGFGGLILCTLLAGLMLIAAGLLRLGTLIKYMPQPVITGFTAGIAVSIFSSQVQGRAGPADGEVPAEFLARWPAYGAAPARPRNRAAVALAVLGLAVIIGAAALAPEWPGFLIALLACTLASLPLSPAGGNDRQRFGELPSALPSFELPAHPVRAHRRAVAQRRSPSRSSPASSRCSRRSWPTA